MGREKLFLLLYNAEVLLVTQMDGWDRIITEVPIGCH